MIPKWTEQQNNAITARGRNILVSAAAGSGKTAVLVERVIRIVTDKSNPVDLDRLLIVTFTNAAAAEMKSRISKSLSTLINENPGDEFYKRQLSLLPGASVCTIDSFCAALVKEHFYDISVSSDFTTLDESELQLLEDNVISEIIDEYFEKDDSDFRKLFEMFTAPGNEKPFISAVKRLLRFIYAQPFPYLWLEDAAGFYNPDISFNKSVWFKYIKDEIDYLTDYALSLANENLSLVDFNDEKLNEKFAFAINSDIGEINRIKNTLGDCRNSLTLLKIPEFVRMPSSSKADKSITEKIKANREIYKTILKEDIQAFLISDENDYHSDMQILYERFKTLISFIKSVDERLSAEKKDMNAYSFSDIEHFAIKLLFICEDGEVKMTKLAKSLSANYYEILVDEYQDTNEAQDLLFSYLSNGRNLFTVGDIKQSIYRFRLAMPHIFNERKKEYAPYDENDGEINSKIILDRNFRSRREICSYVNFIFSSLMTERLGELDYGKEEYLNCAATYNDSAAASAQIKILNTCAGDDADRAEAEYIAKTILEKVKSGELIKDGDSYRPVRFGDFAILMRKVKNHIDTYAEVLTEYGINALCDNSVNLFENSEIRMLVSMIRVIDNPMQDVPLLAVMSSPIYGFTPDELAQIRASHQSGSIYSAVAASREGKAQALIKDLTDLRRISVTMSVSSFIRYLMLSKGIVAFINALGNGEQRYQNILKLISFAEKFDSGVNVGVTAFVRYIDKIAASEKGIDSAPINASGENAVSIMSVHHSKGLEFPICIFAGTARQYNKQDLNDKLLLNTDLGLGMKLHNEERLYQYSTVPYAVIKSKNASELMSENLRVLYVAMTRAKEQFITFITVQNIESRLKKLSGMIGENGIDPYICKKINCDADFILLCALMHNDGGLLREYSQLPVKIRQSDFSLNIDMRSFSSDETDEVIEELAQPDESIIRQIGEKLSFSYKMMPLCTLSAKLAASSLDDADSGFEYAASSKPAFLSRDGLTPAQRGTAMHTFMQFCDYQRAKNSITDEIESVRARGHISAEQAKSLDTDRLKAFFESSIAGEILSADRVHRELRVSSFVSAAELYGVEFDEPVLVQGFADCVIEKNGELTLIDYKTDRVSSEVQLLERYKKQVMFYKSAVSKTLGMPVKNTLLYSFEINKCCYYK